MFVMGFRPPRLSTNAPAYFEDICTSLDSEKGMRDFCRDTFEDGIVPKSHKKALELITLDLKHRVARALAACRLGLALVLLGEGVLAAHTEVIVAV